MKRISCILISTLLLIMLLILPSCNNNDNQLPGKCFSYPKGKTFSEDYSQVTQKAIMMGFTNDEISFDYMEIGSDSSSKTLESVSIPCSYKDGKIIISDKEYAFTFTENDGIEFKDSFTPTYKGETISFLRGSETSWKLSTDFGNIYDD